jgi:hypothetical protein
MTLVFTKDTLFTQGVAPGWATCFYTLKTALVAAGWTVNSSGTGNSGSYSSTGDLISSATVMNGTYAWFRIKAPSGTREFTFQRCSASDSYWRIKVSLTGFTGGSPANNKTPTGGVSETQLIGTIGDTDTNPTGLVLSPNSVGLRAQMAVDNEDGYGFYVVVHSSGAQTRQFCFIVDPIDGYSRAIGDPDPYIYYSIGYGATSTTDTAGNSTYLSGSAATATGNCGSFCYYTSSAPAFYTTGARWHMQSSNIAIPGGLGTNPVDGYDSAFPIPFFRFNYLATTGSGYGGFKGMSSMMHFPSTTRGTGNTFSINTTNDHYSFGDIMLPWDGTTPNI